jgi:hypothetical protein
MFAIRATYLPCNGMRFDEEHYVRVHLPLAQRLLSGRVNFVRMHAEFDMRVLMDGAVLRSPCVFALYVPAEADVETFRKFRASADCEPLRQDVPKYTNCKSEWTVARVVEG